MITDHYHTGATGATGGSGGYGIPGTAKAEFNYDYRGQNPNILGNFLGNSVIN